MPIALVVLVQRQTDLLQVVAALHPPRRFAHRLHRRQQQCDQDADDRDDNEQFDQRERGMSGSLAIAPTNSAEIAGGQRPVRDCDCVPLLREQCRWPLGTACEQDGTYVPFESRKSSISCKHRVISKQR